jgi:hypothetical protein
MPTGTLANFDRYGANTYTYGFHLLRAVRLHSSLPEHEWAIDETAAQHLKD